MHNLSAEDSAAREALKTAYIIHAEKQEREKEAEQEKQLIPQNSHDYPDSSLRYNVMKVVKLPDDSSLRVVGGTISYAGEKFVRHGKADVAILVTEPDGSRRKEVIRSYFEFGKYLVEKDFDKHDEIPVIVSHEQQTIGLLSDILHELRRINQKP